MFIAWNGALKFTYFDRFHIVCIFWTWADCSFPLLRQFELHLESFWALNIEPKMSIKWYHGAENKCKYLNMVSFVIPCIWNLFLWRPAWALYLFTVSQDIFQNCYFPCKTIKRVELISPAHGKHISDLRLRFTFKKSQAQHTPNGKI